jgi:hypothetical protein
MKRDQIEDRLAVMEREIRAFKQEHRQDMETMREELRRFQEVIVEDRIQELRMDLARSYEAAAIGNAIDRSGCALKEKLPDPCFRNMKEKCLKVFRENLEISANRFDSPESQDMIFREADSCDEHSVRQLKGTPCEPCYNIYLAERDSVMTFAGKLVQLRDSLTTAKKETYIADLPDDLVVSGIVDPLSHQARFRMLKSLAAGSLSYSELVKLTGYDGGHLLYHLNRLIDSGLAAKGTDGHYAITKKGMSVMEIVRKMFAG